MQPPAGPGASFRFYEELNDFLPPAPRRREFGVDCARDATVRHMIESLGVPHTEVELVLVNGESVGFDRVVRDGDRVAVYPKFEALDVTPLLRVRAAPLREPRFLADAHLGALARLLRLLGFDTLVAQARAQARVVLSRDRALLKRRDVTHGCFVHALKPREQLQEVVARLDLSRGARPFSRCLVCNGPLAPAEAIAAGVPATARRGRVAACAGCGRVYWEGSHWRRMRAVVDGALGAMPADGR